mmetsp:Transcript_36952/g.62855  ORF Transcript_36952/g.62855 Transcript_36952/m.62855 type:complete len:431 (-) Transcript_36952:180-1472(-)
MKVSLALIAAAPALVSGKRLKKTISPNMDLSGVQLKAESKVGNKVLSKARRLDGDGDSTWIAGYSLKFHSCTEAQDYYGGYFNDENNNANYNNGENNGENGYYYNQNDRDNYEGMYQQKLVHFQLCPSDSCWRCKNGADYVVDLETFVDAIIEAKMTAQEYNCEQVREQCWCDNANNEESCLYNCYKNAGLTECAENMYEDNFEIQEAVECNKLDVEDEDAVKNYIYTHSSQSQLQNAYNAQNGYNYNGNNGQQQEMGEINGDLYVGPYCSANGRKIHLGVFMEETCSLAAPEGIYEALNYGDSLPYSKKSLVDSGCISCKEPKEVDYQNYYDQQDPDEVTDVCSNLYEVAGRCEKGLDGYFPYRDVSGCSFIENLKSVSVVSMPSANVPAKVFAGIFAVTTAILAAISMTLFKKNRRQNVSLAGEPIIS